MSKHEKIHKFLKDHPMGVLSTVNSEGKPSGAAIYYIADEDFNFFFVTRNETNKYQNIINNPKVALTVADSKDQITVQLSGVVSGVPIQEYMDVHMDKFAKIRVEESDHQWSPPIDMIHKGNYMPMMITPTDMKYSDYSQGHHQVKETYTEQIIPA